jgi:hypothetical protein
VALKGVCPSTQSNHTRGAAFPRRFACQNSHHSDPIITQVGETHTPLPRCTFLLVSVLVFQTMAEETKEVPPTEPPAAEGETKQENGKKQAKKNETPIEELFDLTKPIPRVREPHDFRGIPSVDFLRTSGQRTR